MRAIAILDSVRRLLTLEAGQSQDQQALTEAAERVSDKLRAHLTQRIGSEGFRTLLARALTLTTVQFPHMSAVRVAENGTLVGLRGAAGPVPQETSGPHDPQDEATQQEAIEGAVSLLAHLLGLLITFIGEDLTLRMLSAVSPGSTPGEMVSDDIADGENERP